MLAHGARRGVPALGPGQAPHGQSAATATRATIGVWARLHEAGVIVAFHSGESGYGFIHEAWGRSAEIESFRFDPFKMILAGHRPIHDTIAGLVCDGVFTRFPQLRVATIESGSDWVVPLVRALGRHEQAAPWCLREPIRSSSSSRHL